MVFTEEKHTSGKTHLHGYIEYDKKTLTLSTTVNDVLGQVVSLHRVDKGWIRYIIKEDKQPAMYNTDLNHLMEQAAMIRGDKEKVTTQVARMAMTHTLAEVREAFPSYMLLNGNRVEKFQSEYLTEERRKEDLAGKIPWTHLEENIFEKKQDILLASYANYLFENRGKPYGKKCHLWIWGSTNMGKTTFIQNMMKYGTYYMFNNTQAGFQCNFIEGMYDMIIIDDFGIDKYFNLPKFNAFLDGFCKIDRKGKMATDRTQRVPCIFTAQCHPQQMMFGHQQEMIDAFIGRLTVVKIEQKINVLSELIEEGLQFTHRFEN